jgi:plastocyanin
MIAFCVLVAAGCTSKPPANAEPASPPVTTSSNVTGVVPANAIVTLLPATGEPPMPVEPAVIDQVSKQFLPNAIVARVGQPVEFRNSDDLPHNITVTRRTSGSEVFNVSTERTQKYTHTFDRVGQYDVKCDIHEGMEATVIVAQGPTTVIAGNDGQFAFSNVAFGSYRLSVNYAGQTVERPLEVNSARTEVRITP